MDSQEAQLVQHSKLNWEVPGSFPSWGVLIFFLQAWDCQRHLFFTKSHSSSLDEHLYICSRWTLVLKVVSHLLMVRCTNTSHKVTGYWICMEKKDMDSQVAQLLEHSKLNWDVLGTVSNWGVLIILLQVWECQGHLLSLLHQIKFKQSRWTFIHMFKMNSCIKGS